MNVQTNIENVDEARRQVTQHAMCARLEEQGSTIVVIYPLGSHPYIDAVRVNGSLRGKAWAFAQALTRMEKHWREGYPA